MVATNRICRWQSKGNTINLWQIQDFRSNGKVVTAVSRSKSTGSSPEMESDGEAVVVEKKVRKKRAPSRTKKAAETPPENSAGDDGVKGEELLATADSTEDLKKPKTKTRRKGSILFEFG